MGLEADVLTLNIGIILGGVGTKEKNLNQWTKRAK